ncbi:MAG: tetratricopeptide repeat protein, partial [Flavobacteriales bacterium]
MDRERLTELLGTPGDVSRSDLADLRDLAERFPWFSGARLLLAVGEDQVGDVLANDRSTSPAAQLPSRAVLFDLTRQIAPRQLAPMQVVRNTADLDVVHVMGDSEKPAGTASKPGVGELPEKRSTVFEPVAKAIEPPIAVPATKPEPVKSPVPPAAIQTVELSGPPVQVEPEMLSSGHVSLPNAPGTPPVTPLMAVDPEPDADAVLHAPIPTSAALPNEPLAVPLIDDLSLAQQSTALDPLELLYAEAAANAPFNVADLRSVLPATPLPASVPEDQVPVNLSEALPMPDTDPVEHPFTAPKTARLPKNAKLRFTDWLDQADATSLMDRTAASEPAEPGSTTVADILHLAGTVQTAEAPPSPEDILERFIHRSAPAPIKAKAEFFSPQQAAKKSLLDHGLVSETLGRIYEKQGNFAKAKEVYQQLAELDPRKSVYFAALSKALDGRINS